MATNGTTVEAIQAELQRARQLSAEAERAAKNADEERTSCMAKAKALADGSTNNLQGLRVRFDVHPDHAILSLGWVDEDEGALKLTIPQARALAGWLCKHVGRTGEEPATQEHGNE